MSGTVEAIENEGEMLALIVRDKFSEHGITFFTPESFPQQLAYMRHPTGKVIDAHIHIAAPRVVEFTQEVLFIKRGRLRVDFYDDGREYLSSRELGPGDTILLIKGGHGFEVLEELEMIEVKQGPYSRAADKMRFAGRRPAASAGAP